MAIDARAANRYIVAQDIDALSRQELQKSILRQEGVGDDFTLPGAPLLGQHDTLFKVVLHEDLLIVAICLLDIGGADIPEGTRIELLFDTRHDHLGWYSFAFEPDGRVERRHHQPYPEAASTAYSYLEVVEHQWQSPRGGGHAGHYGAAFPAWLFVHLRADELFAHGPCCGFNIGRTHVSPREITSWNLCSSAGFADAASCGHLYRELPTCALSDDIEGWCQNEQLFIRGELSGDYRDLSFDLIDPTGARRQVEPGLDENSWQAHCWLEGSLRGRYRLVPQLPDGQHVEPEWLEIDLFREAIEPACTPGMTYDIARSVVAGPGPYTAAALAAEFDLLFYHGITRLHWLDLPPDAPAWWHHRNGQPRQLIDQSLDNCRDFLHLAVKLAGQRNMEVVGVFRPFDIARNDQPVEDDPGTPHLVTALELEHRPVLVPAGWKHRPGCHAQSHPDWRPDPALPIVKLRLWSRQPLPDLETDDLQLWVSDDNREWTPYTGPVTMAQGEEDRPHLRWTPAGNRPAGGHQPNWYLTWDNLALESPYIAIEILRPDLVFEHRAHALIEAWDAGQESFTPLPADAGDPDRGFRFWKDRDNQLSHSPPLWQDLHWGQGCHGLTIHWPRLLPTLLDPADEGVQSYWLNRVHRLAEAQVDVVSIRTLCHHNSIVDYHMYAWNRQTLRAFESAHGHAPDPESEDDARLLRLLRGEAYTRFIRQAADLTRAADKRFAIHLECGFEVPPHLFQRMAMHLDWQTWLSEELVDEVILDSWYARHRVVQQDILPRARRQGLPVTIVDRPGTLSQQARPRDYAGAILGDSRDAGCASLVFQDMAAYVQRNAHNIPRSEPHIFDALSRAFPAAHLT